MDVNSFRAAQLTGEAQMQRNGGGSGPSSTTRNMEGRSVQQSATMNFKDMPVEMQNMMGGMMAQMAGAAEQAGFNPHATLRRPVGGNERHVEHVQHGGGSDATEGSNRSVRLDAARVSHLSQTQSADASSSEEEAIDEGRPRSIGGEPIGFPREFEARPPSNFDVPADILQAMQSFTPEILAEKKVEIDSSSPIYGSFWYCSNDSSSVSRTSKSTC